MNASFGRAIGVAALLFLLMQASNASADMRQQSHGSANFGVGMAGGYSDQLWECGKTGWGITECPDYGKKPPGETAEPRYGQPPAMSYQPPLDDCMKTGWGITGCPNFGKKPEMESSGAPSLGTVTPYPRQLDDCMKTGWGITECPNYGKKSAPVAPE